MTGENIRTPPRLGRVRLARGRCRHRLAARHDGDHGDRPPTYFHLAMMPRRKVLAQAAPVRSPASCQWRRIGRERVEVGGGDHRSRAVVIAMGPWSVLAAQWIALPAVYGLQSPSLVYDTGNDVPAQALFLEAIRRRWRGRVGRAIPARRRHHAHHRLLRSGSAAGRSCRRDAGPACDRSPSGDRARISPAFRTERIVARQSCFRPVTQDGLPLIGRGAGRRRRLHRHRPQRVGNPQRARDRRSLGRTDRRWRRE